MPLKLTNDQIEELFTQLNASVPHLVMGVLPTPFDCETIRESFELALDGDVKKCERDLLEVFQAQTQGLNLDLSEGSVMGTLLRAQATLVAECKAQLDRDLGWPTPVEVPPPVAPSAEDLVKALADHPSIRMELFELLCRELNYSAIGNGPKKWPSIQQVILDVVGEDPSTGAPNE